jgi:hypothetical protein
MIKNGKLELSATQATYSRCCWSGPATNQQWTFEPVGTGVHIDPTVLATAVYDLHQAVAESEASSISALSARLPPGWSAPISWPAGAAAPSS